MASASRIDPGDPDTSASHPASVAATWIGAVAVLLVVLTQVLPPLLLRALVWTTNDPTTGAAPTAVTTVNGLVWTVGVYVLPLVAAGLALYLVAVRGLPAAPVAAGGFLAALLAPIGFVLGTAFLRPLDLAVLSPEAFFTFATITVGFVLPVVIGASIGAGVETVRQRGSRGRSLGS